MKIVKNILIGLAILFLVYWIFFKLTPNADLAKQTYDKIDSLNHNIDSVEAENKKLDTQIIKYTNEISDLDKSIDRIKNEKTTIKEIYHEKITSVDHFDTTEIDKFFADRYYSGN